MVSQLNKVLKLEESDGVVPNTPSEIFDFLNEYGIEADSLKTSNEDLTLAWNQENNSFALFKKMMLFMVKKIMFLITIGSF